VLVFVGQRVLAGLDTTATLLTAAGAFAVVASTALRFAPQFRVGGERRSIETVLGALSVVGLLGLVAYALTTDAVAARAGLNALPDETFDRVMGMLFIGWVVLVSVAVIPMVFAETAAWPMRHAARPESRRVRAAAGAGFVLVLAAVYGALFVYGARGFEVRADYSYFKTSAPSEPTRKIAQSLKQPVLVRAFFPDVGEVRSEVERYFRDLAGGAPKLQVEFHDRLLVPKLARDLRVNADGTVVITQGEAHEHLRVGAEMKEAAPKLRVLDRDFQEKLLKLARSQRTAYLTVGHGELNDSRSNAEKDPERSVSIVKLLLQRQNYTVKDLGLLQGLAKDVPDDADVVIVLGPAEPFAPEELASLERYAKRGGKLFMALDPEAVGATGALTQEDAAVPPASSAVAPQVAASAAPTASSAPASAAPPRAGDAKEGLAALARVVGLTFNPTLVANDEDHLPVRYNDADRVRIYSNRFSSHASVSTLSRVSSQTAAFFFGTGSLDAEPGSAFQADFTIRSIPGSYGDVNKNFRKDADEAPASFNLAAAVTLPIADGKDKPKDDKAGDDKRADAKTQLVEAPKELRAFVTADAGAFSDFVLGNAPPNQVLFADALRWLVGEESFAGEQTTEEDQRIEHTKSEDAVWFYTSIFGAPALVLGLGLLVGRRRRASGKSTGSVKKAATPQPAPSRDGENS
jgi:hypothetical protein